MVQSGVSFICLEAFVYDHFFGREEREGGVSLFHYFGLFVSFFGWFVTSLFFLNVLYKMMAVMIPIILINWGTDKLEKDWSMPPNMYPLSSSPLKNSTKNRIME